MTYQVLARKLRPTDFSGLIGQDHVVQALVHALDNDRLHHAYLFTGTRGVGKTTIARVLAKCLNCERGVSSKPCGECSSCVSIAEGRFVDLIEMDGASQRGVENIQDLQEKAQYMPNTGRFKIYLIDEVHMLTTHAFNALLKILEEPPEHVKFLFATTEAKKIPVTILSRCLQFQLKNMTVEGITKYLGEILIDEGIKHDAGALRIIGNAAAGSMRDALSVTDQAISYGAGELTEASVARMLGVSGRDEIHSLLVALAAGDHGQVLRCAAELAERGVNFASVLADLLAAFHDIAVAQLVSDSFDTDHLGNLFAASFTAEAVQLHYQIALRGHRDLAFSPEPRIGFEMTLMRMLSFAPSPPASAAAEPPSPDVTESPVPAAPTQPLLTPEPSTRAAAAIDFSDVSRVRAEVKDEQQDKRAPESQSPPGRPPAPASAALAAPPQIEKSVHLPSAPDDFWFKFLATLEIQGVVAMLLRNCQLLERAPCADDAQSECWSLQLDAAHDAMLNNRHTAQMQHILSKAAGVSVVVKLNVGTPAWETPSMQQSRQQQERRLAAIQELRDNTEVQSLLDTFGARLIENSIQPIEQGVKGA